MWFPDRLARSLYGRILASIALVFASGAVLLSLAAYHYAQTAADAAYDRLLVGGVVQVAENVYVQGGVVALEPPVAAFASLSAYDQVVYKVVDPRGVVVAGYPDLDSQPVPAAHRGPVLSDGAYQGLPVRIVTLAKRLSDAPDGWATVTVAQTRTARAALARQLTAQALGIIVALSLLALLAGGLAVRRALAPLARIEAAIAARDPRDLRPLGLATPIETQALVGAIDRFMARLAGRIAVMQRFIADAAHQIRTPLAALAAQVELLDAEAAPARRAELLDRLRARSAELGRLTGQLLNHAMVIHRAEAVALAPVDLVALARTVLAQAVPLSLDREVAIAFAAPTEPVIVPGDLISLREALANVIDNALAHGAATRLAVTVGAGWIEVVDDGPGIPEAEWERVCRPFQSHGGAARSGLGLAIVADVLRAHGGRLAFRRDPSGFAVRLWVVSTGSPPSAGTPR